MLCFFKSARFASESRETGKQKKKAKVKQKNRLNKKRAFCLFPTTGQTKAECSDHSNVSSSQKKIEGLQKKN